MHRYWSRDFHNPSAIYEEGREVRVNIENSRKEMAHLLGVKKGDIVFTSGGTESNNLAILGTFEAVRDPLRRESPILRPHLIISNLEHSSVIESAEEVIRRGGEVSVVEAGEDGRVSPQAVRELIKPNTFLVSISSAHHETGIIQPIREISCVLREVRGKENRYPYLHVDASQTPNYLDVSPTRHNIDFLTLDSSKVYGPRGVGALVVRASSSLRPIILGGEQERGLRAGTENTALIAGFALALRLAYRDRKGESERLQVLKKYFISELQTTVPEMRILSQVENALPNMVAVELPAGFIGEMIILDLDRRGVMVSGGSACLNLGGHPNESLIRFSLGRGTKRNELKKVVKIFSQILNHDKI